MRPRSGKTLPEAWVSKKNAKAESLENRSSRAGVSVVCRLCDKLRQTAVFAAAN